MDAISESTASSNPGSPLKRYLPKNQYLTDSAPKRSLSSPGSGAGKGIPVRHGSLEFREFKQHVADASRNAQHNPVPVATAGHEPAAIDLTAPDRTRRFAEFSVLAEGEDAFKDCKWAAPEYCCCVCVMFVMCRIWLP
jgi:hypothetical protein